MFIPNEGPGRRARRQLTEPILIITPYGQRNPHNGHRQRNQHIHKRKLLNKLIQQRSHLPQILSPKLSYCRDGMFVACSESGGLYRGCGIWGLCVRWCGKRICNCRCLNDQPAGTGVCHRSYRHSKLMLYKSTKGPSIAALYYRLPSARLMWGSLCRLPAIHHAGSPKRHNPAKY